MSGNFTADDIRALIPVMVANGDVLFGNTSGALKQMKDALENIGRVQFSLSDMDCFVRSIHDEFKTSSDVPQDVLTCGANAMSIDSLRTCLANGKTVKPRIKGEQLEAITLMMAKNVDILFGDGILKAQRANVYSAMAQQLNEDSASDSYKFTPKQIENLKNNLTTEILSTKRTWENYPYDEDTLILPQRYAALMGKSPELCEAVKTLNSKIWQKHGDSSVEEITINVGEMFIADLMAEIREELNEE